MAQRKPWLKMWVEWLHDPKMLSLTLAEQGVWWRLVTLAQECAADGYLVKGNGAPMSLEDIANCIHVTRDLKILTSMVKKMEDQGSLTWKSDTLIVTNFAERQSQVPSETKEAVRERVRRYRERRHVTESPLPADQQRGSNKGKYTTLDKDTDTDTDTESNGVTAVTGNEISVTSERKPSLKEISTVIFESWNRTKIVQHKLLTDKMMAAINSALKNYSQEEICRAISNYAEIVHGPEYYWEYRWTLEDFLKRGLEKFMDGEVARQNYRRREGEHGESAKRSPESTGRGETGTTGRRDKEPTPEEYIRSLPRTRRPGK